VKKVIELKNRDISRLVIEALDDLKGASIKSIDVRGLTSITDFMVITTARSNTHAKALADSVVKKSKESGLEIVGTEGRGQSEWVLVDLGDVVVHIMTESMRVLYSLEDLWNFSPSSTINSENQELSEDSDKNPIAPTS
jgi:ribosome-associated protein